MYIKVLPLYFYIYTGGSWFYLWVHTLLRMRCLLKSAMRLLLYLGQFSSFHFSSSGTTKVGKLCFFFPFFSSAVECSVYSVRRSSGSLPRKQRNFSSILKIEVGPRGGRGKRKSAVLPEIYKTKSTQKSIIITILIQIFFVHLCGLVNIDIL